MTRGGLSLALCFSLISAPLMAAEDFRIPQHNRDTVVRTGVGAQASIKIKLGDQRTVKSSDRIRLGINAGPAVSGTDSRNGMRVTRFGNAAGLTFRPGYSASLSFAGKPIATSYTKLGYEQAQKDGQVNAGRKNGVSTLGWVGIGVGAVAAVVLIAFLTCTNEPTSGVDCGIAGD